MTAEEEEGGRYSRLVSNLGLTEPDVDLLLSSEGAQYPPIRARFPDSSILDHLWYLTDLDDEFELVKRRKSKLEVKLEQLEATLHKQQQQVAAIERDTNHHVDVERDYGATTVRSSPVSPAQSGLVGNSEIKSAAAAGEPAIPRAAVNFLVSEVNQLSAQVAKLRGDNSERHFFCPLLPTRRLRAHVTPLLMGGRAVSLFFTASLLLQFASPDFKL